MKKPYSILFVCTGNTCRSPMAEAIARAELARHGITGVKVWSRGLAAGGTETAAYAVSALARLGVRLAKRPSQSLTAQDLEAADLVLTMTSGQKRRIAADWPGSRDKTSVLSEFSRSGRGDIEDPMGGSEHAYDVCASALRDEMELAIPKVGGALARPLSPAASRGVSPAARRVARRGANLAVSATLRRRRPKR